MEGPDVYQGDNKQIGALKTVKCLLVWPGLRRQLSCSPPLQLVTCAESFWACTMASGPPFRDRTAHMILPLISSGRLAGPGEAGGTYSPCSLQPELSMPSGPQGWEGPATRSILQETYPRCWTQDSWKRLRQFPYSHSHLSSCLVSTCSTIQWGQPSGGYLDLNTDFILLLVSSGQ